MLLNLSTFSFTKILKFKIELFYFFLFIHLFNKHIQNFKCVSDSVLNNGNKNLDKVPTLQ